VRGRKRERRKARDSIEMVSLSGGIIRPPDLGEKKREKKGEGGGRKAAMKKPDSCRGAIPSKFARGRGKKKKE